MTVNFSLCCWLVTANTTVCVGAINSDFERVDFCPACLIGQVEKKKRSWTLDLVSPLSQIFVKDEMVHLLHLSLVFQPVFKVKMTLLFLSLTL